MKSDRKETEVSAPKLLMASMLFARSQGLECCGLWKCHWCGAPCSNEFIHDDPPPIPFVRSRSTALCPSESYQCVGCWAWRRPRQTAMFFGGGYLDRQTPKWHSWFITEDNALAIRELSYPLLYEKLVDPPRRFVLALRDLTNPVDTLLQVAKLNDPGGVLADTPLKFTLNNISHEYTVYELGEAIKHGPAGCEPGVHALVNFLGKPPEKVREKLREPEREREEIIQKKGRGKPPTKPDAKDTSRKVVVASGSQ